MEFSELMAMAKAGDSAAVTEVMDIALGVVEAFAAKNKSTAIEPDDLVQNSLLEIYVGLAGCKADSKSQFGGWCAKLTKMNILTARTKINAKKRGSGKIGAELNDYHSVSVAAAPVDVLIAKESMESIWQAAEETSANTLQAIKLASIGMGNKEISEAMGMPYTAVAGLLKRFRAKIATLCA
jgi:RNA polymerase sigma factor (sigma-70 family)